MPGKVIPARKWVHILTGKTASVYGACPWHNEAEKGDWRIEVCGFTVQHPDGTVGIGREPFTSEKLAQDWVDAHPRFSGMSQG